MSLSTQENGRAQPFTPDQRNALGTFRSIKFSISSNFHSRQIGCERHDYIPSDVLKASFVMTHL